MSLPFTRDEFSQGLGAYNAALWPFAALLWAASLGVAVLLLRPSRSADRLVSGFLALHWAWSAVAYHAAFFTRINILQGHAYPNVPTFGVPCPTTIFTVGLLVLARPPIPWSMAIVPLLWTVVGGSAAFLFGVTADLVLPVAGVLLFLHLVRPRLLQRTCSA